MKKYNYLILVAILLATIVLIGNVQGFLTSPVVSIILLVFAGIFFVIYFVLDVIRRKRK